MKSFDSSMIAQLIPEDAGNNAHAIIEVGAHNGSDTANFVNNLKNYFIFAFEPDKRAFKNLINIPSKNRHGLFFENCAISDVDEEIDFYPSKYNSSYNLEWDYSGSILKPKNHLKMYPQVSFESEPYKIDCYRLDTILDCELSFLDEISFIWIDAQGAEQKAINGLGKYLAKTRFIYTEYSNYELYEGQVTKDTLLSSVPTFEVILDDGENMLLKNKEMKG